MDEKLEILTVAQAAKIAQVHPETMREWLRSGKVAGHLISRRAGYRIRREDLERFLFGDEKETSDLESPSR